MSDWLTALPPGSDLVVLALAAMIGGIINSMAGGGSLLMFPILIAVGVPATTANGTVRIAVLVQGLIAAITFHRRGVHEVRASVRLMIPVCVGAAIGSWLATRMPDTSLRTLFGVLLVVWAIVLLFRPARFLKEKSDPIQPSAGVYALALATGLYGGFVQAGVGFPLLALVVLGMGRNTVDANAIKAVIVVAYSAVALSMFVSAGEVAWREGGGLAVGSILGGWIGAHMQLRGGVALVRWVLIAAVIVSAIGMLI